MTFLGILSINCNIRSDRPLTNGDRPVAVDCIGLNYWYSSKNLLDTKIVLIYNLIFKTMKNRHAR